MPPGALFRTDGGWRVVGAAAAGMAPRSSSVRYPQVFCPTPVSEAQERVRALTKVCQAFQPVDGWRSPSFVHARA